MPFKAPDKRRNYFRDLMRERRAAKKAGAPVRHCAFCRRSEVNVAQLWCTHRLICNRCAAEAVKDMQAAARFQEYLDEKVRKRGPANAARRKTRRR